MDWVTGSLPVPHWKRVFIKVILQNLAGIGFAKCRILEGPFLKALKGPEPGNVEKSRLRPEWSWQSQH